MRPLWGSLGRVVDSDNWDYRSHKKKEIFEGIYLSWLIEIQKIKRGSNGPFLKKEKSCYTSYFNDQCLIAADKGATFVTRQYLQVYIVQLR